MDRATQETRRLVAEGRLSIQIEYTPFLEVGEFGTLLTALRDVYVSLLTTLLTMSWPLVQEEQGLLEEMRASPLTIDECHTERSILLDVSAGGAGVVAVSIMLRLIVAAAKAFAEMRKTWHEGTKVKYEARRARLLAESTGEDASGHIEAVETEIAKIHEQIEEQDRLLARLSEVSGEEGALGDDMHAEESRGFTTGSRDAALNFMGTLDGSQTIRRVVINHITIVEKGPGVEEDEAT